jgi:phosphate transport system protein
MSKHLERDLENLRGSLLSVGSLVEEAFRKAIAALEGRRRELAEEVVREDQRIDLKEVEVEEDCLKVLALHQPVALDLRFLAAVMKINNDLERMGDYAVSIAERVTHMLSDPPAPLHPDILPMSEVTRRMLRGCLDAFVQSDSAAARRIILEDDQVDLLQARIIKDLRKRMRERPAEVDQALDLFTVTRRIERIADLSTNVAQDVVYMVEGEIIRHRGAELRGKA